MNELRRAGERNLEALSATRSSMEVVDENMRQIANKLRAHEDNIVLLNETSDAQEAQLQQLSKQFHSMDHSSHGVESAMSAHASALKGLEEQCSRQGAALERLQSVVSPLESNMKGVHETVERLRLTVTSMESNVQIAESAIEA